MVRRIVSTRVCAKVAATQGLHRARSELRDAVLKVRLWWWWGGERMAAALHVVRVAVLAHTSLLMSALHGSCVPSSAKPRSSNTQPMLLARRHPATHDSCAARLMPPPSCTKTRSAWALTFKSIGRWIQGYVGLAPVPAEFQLLAGPSHLSLLTLWRIEPTVSPGQVLSGHSKTELDPANGLVYGALVSGAHIQPHSLQPSACSEHH